MKRVLSPLGAFRPAILPKLDNWDLGLVGSASLSWPEATAPEQVQRVSAQKPTVRCLLVTESLDASGMDEFVAFLARRLPEEGIATAVLLDAESPNWRDGRLAAGLKREGIGVFSATSIDGAQAIKEWSPDVIYVHGAATWPLVISHELNIPALEALHGLHNVFNTPVDQLAKRRGLLKRLVSVSELVKQHYLDRDIDAHPDFLVTIPNGIDKRRIGLVNRAEARSALGLTDEFLFLSLARHFVQKNTYGLADAFLELASREPRAHLLICGRPDDASYTEQVLHLRARAKARAQLHLRDHTDRIDVLLSAADAFILDSFFEGWSLASMEAFGAGLPCILADVGGAREQLVGGPPRGILVTNPIGDPRRVDWSTMASAQFHPQCNRGELISAMSAFLAGSVELATREDIRADTLERFSDDECLRRHAIIINELAEQLKAGC